MNNRIKVLAIAAFALLAAGCIPLIIGGAAGVYAAHHYKVEKKK